MNHSVDDIIEILDKYTLFDSLAILGNVLIRLGLRNEVNPPKTALELQLWISQQLKHKLTNSVACTVYGAEILQKLDKELSDF